MGNDMISKKRATLLGVAVVLAVACSAWSNVIYVDDDAAVGGDGTSWATAHRWLQDALTEARWTGAPVEIRIAQGTYKPDQWWAYPGRAGNDRSEHFFRLDNDMSLLGGYAGIGANDPNRRDAEAYKTVFSGDLLGNDAPVTDAAQMRDDPTREDNSPVMCVYGEGSRLNGCIITGAHWAFGALEIRGGVTVTNCTFSANCGDIQYPGCSGAVSLQTSRTDIVFERCTFTRNAGHLGGALAGHDLALDNCRFAENYAWGKGGGA